tara:strand:+ start:1194 stop:1775 length:582 start_codon:yes stop_codon:yes gene_type:complete
MKEINKVTGYQYLLMKYDNELVDKVFDRLELDKYMAMSIEYKRGSGSTTMLCLEILLTKLQSGYESTISVGRLEDGSSPDYELDESCRSSKSELKEINECLKEAEQLMKKINTEEDSKIELTLQGTLIQEVTSNDTIIVTVEDACEFISFSQRKLYLEHMSRIKLQLEDKHNCQVILVPKDTDITVIKANKDK